MQKTSTRYAELVFGSIGAMQKKLQTTISFALAMKNISPKELDKLCGLGNKKSPNFKYLPKTEEFLADASKITELLWSFVRRPLGLSLNSIHVRITEEAYLAAFDEIGWTKGKQGCYSLPPGKKTARRYLLTKALAELSQESNEKAN